MAHWCLRQVDYNTITFIPTSSSTTTSSSSLSSSPSSSPPPSSSAHLTQSQGPSISPHENGNESLKGQITKTKNITEIGREGDEEGGGAGGGGDNSALQELSNAIMTPSGRKTLPSLIARWPHYTLRLSDGLSPEACLAEFGSSSPDSLWTSMFEGLLRMDNRRRLRLIDLVNFEPSKGFFYLFLQVAPLLTMNEDQLSSDYILEKVSNNMVMSEGLQRALVEFLDTTLKHPVFHRGRSIPASPTRPLVVDVHSMPVCADTVLFFSLLTHVCLHDVTGLRVNPRSIICSFPKMDSNADIDPLLPLRLVQGHFSETLQGLYIQDLPLDLTETMFEAPSLISNFPALTSLGLSNCNLVLSAGDPLTDDLLACLGAFPLLSRLDLTQSEICGCLGLILDSLTHPLVYLNLTRCRLHVCDIASLGCSIHASGLQDLNLTDVCEETIEPPSDALMMAIIENLMSFPSITCINISNSRLPEEAGKLFISTVESMTRLKSLTLESLPFTDEVLWSLLHTVVTLPHIQMVSLNTGQKGSVSFKSPSEAKEFLNLVSKIKNNGRYLTVTDGIITVKSEMSTS